MKNALAMLMLVGVLTGCGRQSLSHKDTGWVTVINDNYMYHHTIKFPDGREVEFFHCESAEGLSKGEVADIQYDGDGSTMGACATNVSIKLSPKSQQEQSGVSFGTHSMVTDASFGETTWVKQDNSKCGQVIHLDAAWTASAYDDMSVPHLFKTQAEAVNWLTTNWCKP